MSSEKEISSVCYFGAYSKSHPRTVVIQNAFNLLGIDVRECHSDHKIKLFRYFDLLYKFLTSRCAKSDIIYVGTACHNYVILAWILSIVFHKPLVFDPLISYFDTFVHDRLLYRASSIRAKLYWLIDKVACSLSDRVIIDTRLHKEFFIETFNLSEEKFFVIPVGADESFFYPNFDNESTKNGEIVKILYAGEFIPLHGLEFVIESLCYMESNRVELTLVGEGQMYSAIQKKVKDFGLANVIFLGRLPKEKYGDLLRHTDIAIGIFGLSEKAERVIPCKVFDAIASGKVVISANTAAAQEVFTNGIDMILCDRSAASIAENLNYLIREPKVRDRIGRQAHNLFVRTYSVAEISKLLLLFIKSIRA